MLTSGKAKSPRSAANIINKDVSVWTVRRSLKKIGIIPAKKPKKPKLTPKQKKARLNFAKSHESWTLDDWKRVL